MKKFARILFFLVLVLRSSDAQAQISAADLVKQLGSQDPNLRASAMSELEALKENARDALEAGARSDHPAIADACAILINKLPWTQAGDPQEAVLILSGYGNASPENRMIKLQKLLASNDIRLFEVALRVISKEPSDEVIWRSLDVNVKSADWHKLLKSGDINQLKPQLVYSLAISSAIHDRKEWVRLMRVFLDREQLHPTAPDGIIFFAVEVMRSRAKTTSDQRTLIPYLRHLISVSRNPAYAERAAGNLLAIQVRYGPFPGMEEDFRERSQNARFPQLAIAHLVSRCGATLPGMMLRDQIQITNDDPEDISNQIELARFAIQLGEKEFAKVGLFKVADQNPPDDVERRLAINANLLLASLFREQADHLSAAQRFEKATDLMRDELGFQVPAGEFGFRYYPRARFSELIQWEYFKHAIAIADSTAAKKIASELAAGDSDDDSLFLDIIDDIQPILPAEDFTRYAERVYQTLKKSWQQKQNDPNTSNGLAWLCARSNIHVDEALPLAKFAVENEPENSAYLDTLAEVYFRLGEPAKSVELEEKALSYMPDEEFMQKQLERFRAAAASQPAK